MTGRPEVVVVGGGITALAAAYELTGGATRDPDAPRVTVLERDTRFGGKLHHGEVAGHVVDVGPDGVLARRPEAVGLVDELGRHDLLRPVAASGAAVYARGRLRMLPRDLHVGVPTSWSSLRRSGTLSGRGLARSLLDVVAPRPAPTFVDDVSVGSLVAAKLGPEVVTTLVDPLLGGIYAGRVEQLSTAVVLPELREAARGRHSLMRSLHARSRAAPTAGGRDPRTPAPAFMTLADGMHSLPTLLLDELRRRDVELVSGAAVRSLVRGDDGRWTVSTDRDSRSASGVLICTPAPSAAALLRPHAPDAAAVLDALEYASVAVVTFAFPEGGIRVPGAGTGALVPAGTIHASGPRRGERWLTTALTYLDQKWPHLAQPGLRLVRSSVGRIDDDRLLHLSDAEIVDIARIELEALLGPMADPIDATVARWVDSLPQYRVDHQRRTARIDADVAGLDGLEIAGAAYAGVGVPACIAQGRAAAARLRAARPDP